MLETINNYIAYIYYIIGVILLIVLVVLIIRIIKVNKSLSSNLVGINDINDKLKAIQDKTDYLKESFSTSWAFFIELVAIIQIIKVIFRDYKGTPKAKRSMIKSAARGVMHSPGTIAKIKKII